MKNYTDSDYALNKINKEAIVYRFVTEIVEVTPSDCLAENPDMTRADFRVLKRKSNADYRKRDRLDNAQTKRNTPFDELDQTDLIYTPTPEEMLIGSINAREKAEERQRRLRIANQALDLLSDYQRRRYLMYHIDGLSEPQIAAIEGSTQQAVSKCLCLAKKKIELFLKKSQK